MYIGITCRYIYEDGIEKQFVNSAYLEYVAKANFTPIILPINQDNSKLYEICDCFLITGGNDLKGTIYSDNDDYCYNIDPRMDKLDKEVIEYALANNKPLLGICRGLQSLNVFLGGTLVKDLKDKSHNKQESNQKLILTKEGSFFKNFLDEEIMINSYHHQGIDKLAPSLIGAAMSNGLIEAIEHKSKMLFAVQWHPERLNDENSLKIIKNFKVIVENKK